MSCEDETTYNIDVLDDGKLNISHQSAYTLQRYKLKYKRDTELVDHFCEDDKCILDIGDDYRVLVAEVGNDGTEKHIEYVRNDMNFFQRWLHDMPFLRGVFIVTAVISSLIALCFLLLCQEVTANALTRLLVLCMQAQTSARRTKFFSKVRKTGRCSSAYKEKVQEQTSTRQGQLFDEV